MGTAAVGGFPAVRRDFDKLALGVGEVEEDLAGGGAGPADADTAEYGAALVGGVLAGQGFEEIEDGLEGMGGGDEVVFGVDAIEEPIAPGWGAEGEDGSAPGGGGGKADEDLAVAGGEGLASSGDVGEAGDGRRLAHKKLLSILF